MTKEQSSIFLDHCESILHNTIESELGKFKKIYNKDNVKIAPKNMSEEDMLAEGWITQQEYDEMRAARTAIREAIATLNDSISLLKEQDIYND